MVGVTPGPAGTIGQSFQTVFLVTVKDFVTSFGGLPELAYPFHDRVIHVTNCGRICLHRKKINLSTVFAGRALRIKEVEEGIWLVSFMEYDLGYIDLEEKTLQPLDNPFGPKVLPM